MDPQTMKEKAEKIKAFAESELGVSVRINVRQNHRKTSDDPFATAELYNTQLEFESYIPGPAQEAETKKRAEEAEAVRKARADAENKEA